ncbi:hypothetical protein PDJAM_G00255570 [Pangasius djambal]|uniref:Uncharacterized protein n=1 Tax=Pangasius djambal TaxID=1691987 RepID=A0ACC5YM68_9TELE|nr:hypothetical protein [Pangasius djambal]
MDLNHLILLKIVFFLLGVLTIGTSGQICSAPLTVDIQENNSIGATVATITTQAGVDLSITVNPEDAFGLNGTLLVVNKVLDYESLPEGGGLSIAILCTKGGESPLTIRVFVIVQNVNDNPPVFAKNPYTLDVDELSKVDTSVGKFEATDLDKDPLYYKLVSPMNEFGLQAESNPEILVKKVLDYDTIKEVTLHLFAQDTPLSSSVTPSHTASTTIIVTILDINNRPPWFQPCTETTVGTAKICITSGYTGNVSLNKTATDPLTLKPGPVYAIDGDKGRNDIIRYSIIGGNEGGIFNIDENSGNITMRTAVDKAGPIILTVMAYELENPDYYATTTVTLEVVISSNHPPKFVKPEYEGFISEDAAVGSLVLESKSSNKPLWVQATDADFSDGVNPSIKFEVPVGSDFRITPEGFIVLTKAASPGIVNLQISVVDSTNGESSTASLSIEVTPVTTTDMSTTTGRSTTTAMTTTMAISLATSLATSIATTTNVATDTTTIKEELPVPSGDFKSEDMIALGVSLGVALLLCFVVIGFLAYNFRRFSADWKKLSEASIFRSSLSGGSGGPKDGVQYTNEGFQADEDTDSVTSKQAAELVLPRGPELSRKAPEVLETQSSGPTVQSKSSNDNSTLPADSSSQNASDNADKEKEVKPILTKERRMEDGYKAVWFKEDIDPNDKEEVQISDRDQDIDHEDDDHDDDDDDDEEEEEEDSNFAEL